ncbi:hypothetical protein OAC91_02475 [Candidatus Marinimicrobia bacterium]|nr:hypothetical protein [Candidatus Neomarinimicrobiota bacterium]
MKRLLLIVLPLLLIVGCSKPISEETLIDKDELMYTPDSDKPYTGEVFTNYDTGEKSYQGTYENGLLVQYSYLNKDGSVKEPVNGENLIERSGLLYTVNGQKPYTGEVFELHDNGNKKLDGYYKDGLMNGDWVGWSENGQKEWEGSFDGSKVLEKIKFSYDDNGQKLTEDYYDNEDIYIDSRYFNNDRSLKDTVKFEELKELRDGRDFLIVSKNTNKPFTGISKTEENNNLMIIGLKNGKLHGRYLVYENGTLKNSSTFKNHKKDGLTTNWYENGQKSFERTWKDGIEDGLETQWFKNGQKKEERTYKDGEWISGKGWNEDGSVKE